MILAVVVAGQLATRCAPEVAPGTLVSIAGTESGFNTLAIHDNTTGSNYAPASSAAARTLARALIGAGHSIDLGLMQINSANLTRLGLTAKTAFNACASLGAAGRLLVMDYRLAGGGSEQPALQAAFSRYNTGNGVHGFQNGYVERVVGTARRVVPEINPAAPIAAPQAAARPTAPAWDVFGHHAPVAARPIHSAPSTPSWNVFPRSVGPARLAQHNAVIVTAHRLAAAGASHPQRTAHDQNND